MTEGDDRQQATETENVDAERLREGAEGDKSTNPAQATPPLEDDSEPDQTQVPAPDDDVGGQQGGEHRPSE